MNDRIPPRAVSEKKLAHYRARLAELDAEFREGKWLDRAGVERVTFERYRTVRDRLLAIPDRVGPAIAGIADVQLAIMALRDEITAVLEELAEGTFDGRIER